MRGKVERFGVRALGFGITPAYAGKRAPPAPNGMERQDHPRVCGEKPVNALIVRICMGITPAYAGKRRFHRNAEEHQGDHPRVCGEKRKFILRTFSRLGSPPRMRGKGLRSMKAVVRNGITPAYAGKSLGSVLHQARSKDHPRVCGEKGVIQIAFKLFVGSPPRMRGKGVPAHH